MQPAVRWRAVLVQGAAYHPSTGPTHMIFSETKLKGAFIIDLERRGDSRGFFARAFCQNEFAAHGLKTVIAQAAAIVRLDL